ncbi:MAG: IS630 family transposase [Candidatus Angelobacter sp.]
MNSRDGRALDHKTLEQMRVRAVERVQAGESPELVIQALGFTRSCIYAWLARYRTGGWGALKARVLKGRPTKIQAAQMRWVYRTITGKSPLQFRFEFALWTREIVRVLLREQFQLKLSLASVGRLLKQLGLSCQRPLFRATEQDPQRVREWLKREYPAIREEARRAGAEIYFGDEAGVRSDCHAGTTWGIRGKTPVVRSTGQRSSVNMLSAVSARGAMRFMLTKGKVNGPVFLEFLKRLMHNAPRPVFLILDGGSYHRSRPVKNYVAGLDGKLRLFFLPPYSPELNPDEQVWNYVKHHGVAKAALRGGKELRKFVMTRLQSLQKMPWTIRMFFLTPDTRYAVL